MQSSKRARRVEKAFLSQQYKEIEENNRMGKTRDLFKKMRDTKGTFCEKKGTMLNKWYGPNRSRIYKKRGQEYIKELCKTDLHNPDNHDGMITHLEPDILEC